MDLVGTKYKVLRSKVLVLMCTWKKQTRKRSRIDVSLRCAGLAERGRKLQALANGLRLEFSPLPLLTDGAQPGAVFLFVILIGGAWGQPPTDVRRRLAPDRR